ncbi:hypothetical protein MMC25_006436 [Agyrium rufum]|nr:hypothetical protein [Agyrium rufum]
MTIAESDASSVSKTFKSPRRELRCDKIAAGATFLFNPLTVASCLGRSTILFTNCAILLAISRAVTGKPINAMLFLALASYLSMYPALLLPPMLLLSSDRAGKDEKEKGGPTIEFALKSLCTFLASIGFLLGISYIVTGSSWDFVAATYGAQLLLPDLTPNVGLWWYFFTEIFDSFREFFLGVFWLHLASYVGGLTIRFQCQPLFAITTMLGAFAIFKPYPSISDTSLYLAMLTLYRHVFPLMRYTFFATATLLYASFLGPAFHYLWVYAGSGNANFFYAITLVWSLGLSVVVSDSIFAVLRDEWEFHRPEMKGKDVRQI